MANRLAIKVVASHLWQHHGRAQAKGRLDERLRAHNQLHRTMMCDHRHEEPEEEEDLTQYAERLANTVITEP